MEFSTSQRGGRVLIFEGFEYLLFRTVNGIQSWRCRQCRSNRCKSMMKTKDDEILQPPTEHSHESCPQRAKANSSMAIMKENMTTVSATPRNVIGNVLSTLSDDVLAHMPKQSSLVRNLLNHKKGNHLPNPTSLNFIIPDKYCEMILHDTGVNDPDRILVIGDRALSQQLRKDVIFGDGTFDKSPNVYYQLYSWHAKVGNSYPPCLYFLLTKKDSKTYLRMFDILKKVVPDISPQRVLLDFEKAAINAARITFPEAEVKGCLFHLCQSVCRKVNSVGLKAQYEGNVEVKLKLKSLPALTFVPITDVRNVFHALARTFPNEDPYNEVLSYFHSTYIEGVGGRDPQFPISTWNHHEAALEQSPKTTNCCEGFHNSLNSIFHCSHPSVWSLFNGLKRDMACHKLILIHAEAGRPEVKKRKYVQLEQLIANVVGNYDQEEDKLKYLRRLANVF